MSMIRLLEASEDDVRQALEETALYGGPQDETDLLRLFKATSCSVPVEMLKIKARRGRHALRPILEQLASPLTPRHPEFIG